MTERVFLDRALAPSEQDAVAALGGAARYWTAIRDGVAAEHGPVTDEWVWSGKAAGWSLRLKRKDRAIVYLTPCREELRASFAIGEKAAAAAHDTGLREPLLALIDAAPRYAEGRAVRLEVACDADVEDVLALVRIKLAS